MADDRIKTGISAGNGGEMGNDGHVAPGGEMASMPGGPPTPGKKHDERPEKQNLDRENQKANKEKKAIGA